MNVMENPELKKEFTLEIPGDPLSLALVRLMIRHLAHQAGFGSDQCSKIELSVDEALTNIIEHAYEDLDPKPAIHLAFDVHPHRFIAEIIDSGKTFDFSSYRPPNFPDHWDQGNTRGVGLYLIRQCMDEVSYHQLEDSRNKIRLVKHSS